LAFALALGTDLACLYVEDDPSMIVVILQVKLDQPLAFLATTGLTGRGRNFPRFQVLKFNQELPFGNDGDLSHAHKLYAVLAENTISCVLKKPWPPLAGFNPCIFLEANQLLRLS
jgi:hypothetical protein